MASHRPQQAIELSLLHSRSQAARQARAVGSIQCPGRNPFHRSRVRLNTGRSSFHEPLENRQTAHTSGEWCLLRISALLFKIS